MNKKVLAIFAHPDDAEFMCAGTLSLLKKQGWEIHIATMTPGDKGTAEYTREEISAIRKAEAKKAAGLIGGTYHCLEFEDLYILYNRKAINDATSLIRKVRPDIVFTASPDDYIIDHEMTSRIVQTACFACGIKNMEVQEEFYEPVPYLVLLRCHGRKRQTGEAAGARNLCRYFRRNAGEGKNAGMS